MNVLRLVTMPLFLAAGLMATVANASVVTFTGGDSGANSTDPRPTSNATATSFDAAASALGTISLITFESAPVGTYTSLNIASGVTLTGTDFTGSSSGQSIRNSPFGSPDSLFGYNTTSGGANFAFINGGFLTFSFTNPIVAFGAYLSGLQLDNETVTFNDGTSQSITIPNLGSGVEFVGFTDAGKLISSVKIDTTSASSPAGDFVAVDDLRYVGGGGVSAVPLPAALPLFATGLGALGLLGWRRKRKAQAAA
jgi:hypothetical protein